MVPVTSLWLPILLSAVAVFLLSWLFHMLLPYHHKDFKKLPNEDGVMQALRPFNIPPGDYMMPCGGSSKAMKDPVFIEKFKKGPVALITVMRSEFNMGKSLGLWFVYCVVVSIFAAYVGACTLEAGTLYSKVMQVTGSVAFAGYVLALWQSVIWYKRSVGATFLHTIDGLFFALATGFIFSRFWP